MYMAGTALDLLWALDLSSFLFNGYHDFTPAERRLNMKLSAQQSHFHPPKQKCTTTQVKTSWHVDKASLHIEIILLFPKLEPGNRTATLTQVSLYQPAKTHTHTHTHRCESNMLLLLIQWNLKPNLTLPEMHDARTCCW